MGRISRMQKIVMEILYLFKFRVPRPTSLTYAAPFVRVSLGALDRYPHTCSHPAPVLLIDSISTNCLEDSYSFSNTCIKVTRRLVSPKASCVARSIVLKPIQY